jgi:DNA-directed RNA polymerase specialized sigma24 family protein
MSPQEMKAIRRTVRRLSYMLAGTYLDTEDVVQECALAVWRNAYRPGIKKYEHFRYTVILRRMVHTVRKHRRGMAGSRDRPNVTPYVGCLDAPHPVTGEPLVETTPAIDDTPHRQWPPPRWGKLDAKEQDIVARRVAGYDQSEIAPLYGVSRQAIAQTEKKALGKLMRGTAA